MLHGDRIKLTIRLGARAAHRRPLAAVQHAELDSRLVGHAPHEPIESIDLAHQMALAETADCRIARHGAHGGEAVGDEGGRRAEARGRRRGFAAGVPSAHDDDVKRPHDEIPVPSRRKRSKRFT